MCNVFNVTKNRSSEYFEVSGYEIPPICTRLMVINLMSGSEFPYKYRAITYHYIRVLKYYICI